MNILCSILLIGVGYAVVSADPVPMTRFLLNGKDVNIIQTEMSWQNANNLCRSLGQNLVVFDPTFPMYDVVRVINNLGLSKRSFWVGGHNLFGSWQWITGAPMPLGTPFWGLSADRKHQEPFEANPGLHPSNYACMWGGNKYHFLYSCWNSGRNYAICTS